MALNKEQILTLTCLKEVGCTGLGFQKVIIKNWEPPKDHIFVTPEQLFSDDDLPF